MASLINSAGATGTGSMTIQGPNTNSNQVLTIPDATGTVMVSGNMPAFSYYSSSGTSVTNATFTKISFTTSEFDTTGSMYASSRFTPTIAGYYQISGCVNTATASGISLTIIYKNGSRFKDGSIFLNSTAGNQSQVSALIYLNGSTDYVELWFYQTSGVSQTTGTTASSNYFQAIMVRSA
jgi:hypothetical protein